VGFGEWASEIGFVVNSTVAHTSARDMHRIYSTNRGSNRRTLLWRSSCDAGLWLAMLAANVVVVRFLLWGVVVGCCCGRSAGSCTWAPQAALDWLLLHVPESRVPKNLGSTMVQQIKKASKREPFY
jgi:hypothetical protein